MPLPLSIELTSFRAGFNQGILRAIEIVEVEKAEAGPWASLFDELLVKLKATLRKQTCP